MNVNEKNIDEKCVEERMPKLSQEHMALAANEDSKKGVDWLIEHYNIGDIHNEGNGVTLQIVSEQKVRCIRLYDDPGAWYCLSVAQETFKCANIEFEIDPIVIITPMEKRVLGAKDKAEKDTVSGLDKSEKPSRTKEATQTSLDTYGMEVA
jgi:hypothetical protein